MVSMAVENTSGLFFQPMGKTKGNATNRSLPGAMGKATPNFGMSSTLRAIQ
jgi:hypothetical protein